MIFSIKKISLSFLSAVSLYSMEPLVTPNWLHSHLGDDKQIVIQVNDLDTYNKGHIPYALQTDISKWNQQNGFYISLTSKNEMLQEIQRLGIDSSCIVVLYSNIQSLNDLLNVTYVYWALNYNGIESITILNGGMNRYENEGFKLQTGSIEVNKSDYKSVINKKIIADKKFVASHIGKIDMIDARTPDKYLGITKTDNIEKAGHIKNSMSFTWNYAINKDYTFKDIMELDAMFRDGYELYRNRDILVYGTNGLEASFNYYLLSKVLGYTNVRVYDASMMEWGNASDTKVAKYKYEVPSVK